MLLDDLDCLYFFILNNLFINRIRIYNMMTVHIYNNII